MKRRYVWSQATESPSGPLCKVHSTPVDLNVYVISTMATDTMFKDTWLSLLLNPTFLYAGKSFKRLLPWSFSNFPLLYQSFLILFSLFFSTTWTECESILQNSIFSLQLGFCLYWQERWFLPLCLRSNFIFCSFVYCLYKNINALEENKIYIS